MLDDHPTTRPTVVQAFAHGPAVPRRRTGDTGKSLEAVQRTSGSFLAISMSQL